MAVKDGCERWDVCRCTLEARSVVLYKAAKGPCTSLRFTCFTFNKAGCTYACRVSAGYALVLMVKAAGQLWFTFVTADVQQYLQLLVH